ncbi:DUF1828 domain-containing protein [Vreelandella venusta]|uniref:DUF1828 domain-containing protein n=1 Tax=Vreelandella venusta TaxID=44935 RepID=UPI0040447CC3
MNCAHIIENVGFSCQKIKEDVTYISSPYSLGYDPERIGAFVLKQGGDKLYITDDGNQLFTAQTHGLTLNKSKTDRIVEVLSRYGVSLTESGEVAGWCTESSIREFLPRYLEASIRLSDEVWEMFSGAPSLFEDKVAKLLEAGLPKRVKRDATFIGASGHQLSFPFVIDFGTPSQKVVQTIATKGEKPRWSLVMQALGKLVDLKAVDDSAKAFVVLEQSNDEAAFSQVRTALVDYASVMDMSDHSRLLKRLAA